MKKLFITALSATMMFAACDKPDNPETGKETEQPKGPIEAKFTTKIAPMTTRMAYGAFQVDDEMGIFMKSAGSMLEYGNALSNNVLARFTRAGSVQYQIIEMTPSIIYPESGNVDFIAYYPYSNNPVMVWTSVEEREGEESIWREEAFYALLVDANDQSEVLYSNNAANISPSETPVALNFKYSMAKLKVTVTAAAGSETLTAGHFTNMTAMVNKVNTSGYLNLATGNFLDNEYLSSSEMYLRRPASYGQPATSATFEALVLPTAEREHIFTFNINGNSYRVPLTRGYEAGVEYTLPFQLNIGTPPEVVYMAAQATITARTPDTSTPTTTVTDSHIDNRTLVEGISVATENWNMMVGQAYAFDVRIYPVSATHQELKVVVTPYNVASAEYSNGSLAIRGLSAGRAVITLTATNGTPDDTSDDVTCDILVYVAE